MLLPDTYTDLYRTLKCGMYLRRATKPLSDDPFTRECIPNSRAVAIAATYYGYDSTTYRGIAVSPEQDIPHPDDFNGTYREYSAKYGCGHWWTEVVDDNTPYTLEPWNLSAAHDHDGPLITSGRPPSYQPITSNPPTPSAWDPGFLPE